MASSGLTPFCHMHNITQTSGIPPPPSAAGKGSSSTQIKGQSPPGCLSSVHSDLSSCMGEEIVWNGAMLQEEAVTLLTFQVVICSECEISHFQLHVPAMS